jgi:hypothetical protein
VSTLRPETFETGAPTEADARLARESSRRLATHQLGRRDGVRIQLLDDGQAAEPLVVPAAALRLLLHALTEMARGNAVTLVPVHAASPAQQAASEPPVADFLEPVRYEWTEAAYEARRAVKRYSEQTHADY